MDGMRRMEQRGVLLRRNRVKQTRSIPFDAIRLIYIGDSFTWLPKQTYLRTSVLNLYHGGTLFVLFKQYKSDVWSGFNGANGLRIWGEAPCRKK
jgi:hypothetical protein